MPRVLVVSRNPVMAMGLSATTYDVQELRPQAFADWVDGGDEVDALVLDLERPELALAAVTQLRARGQLAPVLLVSSDRPGWEAPELRQLPATEVLPLPVSRPALVSALGELLGEPREETDHPSPTPALRDSEDDESPPASDPVPVPKPAPAPDSMVPEHPPLTAVPRTRRSTPLPRMPGGSSAADPGFLRTPRADTVQPPDAAIALVRRLSERVHELYGVPEAAEVVISDAVERTRADAGALLMPDDGRWRVSGGVGLRPLEHRLELWDDSWLVTTIVHGRKGAIIEDSDIARLPLHGAPLASWRHLLAAPVPDADALVLVARREDPSFDQDDLATLASLGQEAAPLLAAAADTRRLARALGELRDDG